MKKIFYSMMALIIAAFTLTSCEDVPMPYEWPGTGGGSSTPSVEPVGTGTVDDPYNIAALNEFASTLEQGQNSDKQIYFRGKVVTVKECSAQYGNATFYLSDTGSNKNQFYVYRCLGLNNQPVTSDDLIHEGDEVVVCGTITNYNGTLETVQKGAYIVSINGNGQAVGGETAEPKGTGTEADPYNVAAAQALIKTLAADVNSDEVYVSGIVSTITSFSAQYGNFEYYISDDGSTAGQLQIYHGLGLNKAKFTSDQELKVGDKVVVKGKLVNFKGNTPEMTNGNYLVSLNGQGSTGGGNDQPAGNATEITCAKAVEICNGLEDKAETAELYTITGYITDTDGKISRNQQVFWMADTKDGGKVFEAYWANIPDPTKALPVGTKVKMTGKLMRYGTTAEMKNGDVVVLEAGNGNTGGNDNTGDNTGSSEGLSINGTTVTLTAPGVTAGRETVVLTVNDLGLADKASAIGTYTLSDGSTLTISTGDGKSGPTYYAATNGFRIYASNVLKFECKKNVAKIAMECDSYNGTDYVGNTTATVSFDGKNVTYCNKNDANSGGVQLRVKKITITYAN